MDENDFPVTASTISAFHLGKFLREQYQLGSNSECRLFRTGINHLYIITDDTNKFVFRIYTWNWRTKLEIEEEIRLLLHLKHANVPVAYPIPDVKNDFIQEFNAPEGTRFGVLFSFANGGKKSQFTPEISYQIGIAMGNMHQATKDFKLKRITYHSGTLLVDSLQKIRLFFNPGAEEVVFIEQATQYLLNEYEGVSREQVRNGAVHLDIWFDNMHFQGNEITIFDFDFCGNGWLCYDIAYYMVQLFNTNPDQEAYELKIDRFIKGYETVNVISEEEKRIMPFLCVSIWFFYLGVQCDRFDNWSNVFLNDDHLKRFTGIIKKWMVYNHLTVN